MIKETDCNEVKNLAEFYIFIWGTARRLATTKTSGQSNYILVGCRFKDESRLFYFLSKTFSAK
jgi:hypothetical protein